MKVPIIGTGLSGLVGSRLVKDFSDVYEFQNLDLQTQPLPVDITKLSDVQAALAASPAEFVVHFAAYTNVTGAWEQRDDKSGAAYQVNVTGTANIVRAAAETGKHVIHISTAYVFDGEKAEPYLETDPVHPIERYGQTKAGAEDEVTTGNAPWTILRIDQPFRSDPFPKKDIVHRIIDGLRDGTLPPQFTNHTFGPTFIDDFAKVIDWVIRTRTTGLFHASSGETWTDYDFASAINDALQLDKVVQKGDLNTYLKTLSRPYQKNTALNCKKLSVVLSFQQLGVLGALHMIS